MSGVCCLMFVDLGLLVVVCLFLLVVCSLCVAGCWLSNGVVCCLI